MEGGDQAQAPVEDDRGASQVNLDSNLLLVNLISALFSNNQTPSHRQLMLAVVNALEPTEAPMIVNADLELMHQTSIPHLFTKLMMRLKKMDDALGNLDHDLMMMICNDPSSYTRAISEAHETAHKISLFLNTQLLPLPVELLLHHLIEAVTQGRLVVTRQVWRAAMCLQSQLPSIPRQLLTFPHGQWNIDVICDICFETASCFSRLCCNSNFCDFCLTQYLNAKVNMGQVKIQCANATCSQVMHKDEIMFRLSEDCQPRFTKYLVDANGDPTCKTCPFCNQVTKVSLLRIQKASSKIGLKVTCLECGLDWCFSCHSPYHVDMACHDYQKGDRLLRKWARTATTFEGDGPYQRNAQKCPKCKIFISKNAGCDHMTCTQCATNFCYKCGGRYLKFPGLGHHNSRLSVFGCPYRFKPGHPHLRRFVRGSLLAAKVTAAPLVGALTAGVGAVALVGAGLLVGPIYGGVKLYQKWEVWRVRRRYRHLGAIQYPPLVPGSPLWKDPATENRLRGYLRHFVPDEIAQTMFIPYYIYELMMLYSANRESEPYVMRRVLRSHFNGARFWNDDEEDGRPASAPGSSQGEQSELSKSLMTLPPYLFLEALDEEGDARESTDVILEKEDLNQAYTMEMLGLQRGQCCSVETNPEKKAPVEDLQDQQVPAADNACSELEAVVFEQKNGEQSEMETLEFIQNGDQSDDDIILKLADSICSQVLQEAFILLKEASVDSDEKQIRLLAEKLCDEALQEAQLVFETSVCKS